MTTTTPAATARDETAAGAGSATGSVTGSATGQPPVRRRQSRGQARIEQILDAATLVFAEKGYESATTNAIAARAGISPGSLYQFFGNKEAVAEALAERYVREMGSTDNDALSGLEGLPLDQVLNLAIDRLVEANLRDPGLKALLARTDMPPQMAAATETLHEAVRARVAELIQGHLPALAPAELELRSQVVMQISKALMVPICSAADRRTRDALVAELKRALLAYLTSPAS